MRFAMLGSGSRGNGCLVEVGATTVLVDCGFSVREAERRLARLGKMPADIAAIAVTHEHGDHARGVAALAQKYAIPVYMTHGTRLQLGDELGDNARIFSSNEAFSIGDVGVDPYPVPHDAREPAQFVFHDGQRRLGLLTDVGMTTPHIERQLRRCDALLLECNHDTNRLEQGEYPPSIKQRIRGQWGHLSNEQAGSILAALDHSLLQHVVALHLSEKHNTPYLARAALSAALNCESDWVGVADQDNGLDWRSVD